MAAGRRVQRRDQIEVVRDLGDDDLGLRRVGEDAREDLAGLVLGEEAERQPLEVTVEGVAQVARDVLLQLRVGAIVFELALGARMRQRRRFRLESVHPGHTVEEVRDQTGFAFDATEQVPTTPAPEPETLSLIRSAVAPRIAEPTTAAFSKTSLSGARRPLSA